MDVFALNFVIKSVQNLSRQKWGDENVIDLVGQDEKFLKQVKNLISYSKYEYPVLINGETGVGKELFAKALYLLSPRIENQYITVNCPQYQDPNLAVSSLFGHKKGSYTGADHNHKGFFEQADKGTIFLDEIGDVHPSVQPMLLRVLSDGEFISLGEEKSKKVDVRLIAATNKIFSAGSKDDNMRNDLFYRIKFFRIDIPPLRERGDDWKFLINFYLKKLSIKYNETKYFSDDALKKLSTYSWPGNIRELSGLVISGYSLADEVIEMEHIENELNDFSSEKSTYDNNIEIDYFFEEGNDFWKCIQKPFLNRDLNRNQVRGIIEKGLEYTSGSYKRLLPLFNIEDNQYLKFMDFLRTHDLKPNKN